MTILVCFFLLYFVSSLLKKFRSSCPRDNLRCPIPFSSLYCGCLNISLCFMRLFCAI